MKRWHLAHGRHLDIGPEAILMGILNVTPDSFSDGGRYERPDAAVAQAMRMIAEGARIIDIGGESTRPGAGPVAPATEQARILPVIAALSRQEGALLSVDTSHAETARLAVAAGAHIVNDVTGLRQEPGIARIAAETGAGLVVMHTGRGRRKLPDVIDDQFRFFEKSLATARRAGVRDGQIVLDPGFAFGKSIDENLDLIVRFRELGALGFPLLVGTSRKRLADYDRERRPAARDVETAATSVILRLAGADLFRVHNVAVNSDALKMADAVLAEERRAGPAPD